MNKPMQLSLGISLRDEATFNNFYFLNDHNAQVLNALRQIACGNESSSHFIWGAAGCGLSHLLQALCIAAGETGRIVHYLPLSDLLEYDPFNVCDGLEYADILCVDGVELICRNRNWELALFHLFNRFKDSNKTMVFSAHDRPDLLAIELADLKSRLLSCLCYHVDSMTDQEKEFALIKRAHDRGMEMPQDIAKYILSRAARDTNVLFNVLERLDDATLREQRKLTIPFVKDVLGF